MTDVCDSPSLPENITANSPKQGGATSLARVPTIPHPHAFQCARQPLMRSWSYAKCPARTSFFLSDGSRCVWGSADGGAAAAIVGDSCNQLHGAEADLLNVAASRESPGSIRQVQLTQPAPKLRYVHAPSTISQACPLSGAAIGVTEARIMMCQGSNRCSISAIAG